MKIRTDFVTNSSSSSFVLAFKDKKSVLKELSKDQILFEDETSALGELIGEILDSKYQLSEKGIENLFEEYIKYELPLICTDKLRQTHKYYLSSHDEVMASEDYSIEMKKLLAKTLKIKDDILTNHKYVVSIAHGRNYSENDTILEGKIGKMKNCVLMFDNH